MSTIERLAELAKGATQGEWRLRLSDNATPFIMHENGVDWTDIEDRTSIVCWMPAEISFAYNSLANARLISACNPAAIAQAHAEYAELARRNAELVAERDALKDRIYRQTMAAADLFDERDQLRTALQALYDDYKAGADSGDWGNWDFDSMPEAVAARAALAHSAQEKAAAIGAHMKGVEGE